MSHSYRSSVLDASNHENSILFFSAIDRRTNQVYGDPYKLLQLPYLDTGSIEDFCRMNSFQEITHPDDIQSDAYQKSIYRNNIPDDLDARLYKIHILGNERYFLTFVEIHMKYFHILFQRKLQIPNRNFLFRLCQSHYKLKYHDYFLNMFYSHLVSEALMFYPIDPRKNVSEIQAKIQEFLDTSEQTSSISVLRNKFLALDQDAATHGTNRLSGPSSTDTQRLGPDGGRHHRAAIIRR